MKLCHQDLVQSYVNSVAKATSSTRRNPFRTIPQCLQFLCTMWSTALAGGHHTATYARHLWYLHVLEVQLRFTIHTGVTHPLVWHNTTLDVKYFGEFRLYRERQHCSDSASCLQLARRFWEWAYNTTARLRGWQWTGGESPTKESYVARRAAGRWEASGWTRYCGVGGKGAHLRAAERLLPLATRRSFPLLRNKRSINFLIRRA